MKTDAARRRALAHGRDLVVERSTGGFLKRLPDSTEALVLNLDYDEFAAAVGEDGIFRGFPRGL